MIELNREKANKLLEVYGRPALKFKESKNVLVFARQDMKDVEEIEKMSDNELIKDWKGLVWLNCIYGQVSLNDMQRIQLIELEIDTRPKINVSLLNRWFEREERKKI